MKDVIKKVLLVIVAHMVLSTGTAHAVTRATYYIRDANGNVIAEYDENGELKHFNLYGLDLIGRIEPSGEKDVVWKRGTETINTFRSVKSAMNALSLNEDGYTGIERLEIRADREVMELQVAKSNLLITGNKTNDETGAVEERFDPVFVSGGTNGSYQPFDNDVTGVTADGIDFAVKAPNTHSGTVVLKGDLVIRNSLIQAQKASDWLDEELWTQSKYGKRIALDLENLRISEYDGRVSTQVWVTITRDEIDYASVTAPGEAGNELEILFCDKTSSKTVYNHEVVFWNNDAGESGLWVDVSDIAAYSNVEYIWMYYDKK